MSEKQGKLYGFLLDDSRKQIEIDGKTIKRMGLIYFQLSNSYVVDMVTFKQLIDEKRI